jgi:hypothetical protein
MIENMRDLVSERHELMARIQELTVENGRLRAGLQSIADYAPPGLTQTIDEKLMRAIAQDTINQQTTRYVCETCQDNPYLCSTIPTSHCAKAEAIKDE